MNFDESENIKILVCCHKPCELPHDSMYLPIHVGAIKSQHNLNIQRDDDSNNSVDGSLSSLNNIYCEMTGMYWAWKNIREKYPNVQYVGLCHYRRFFNAFSSPLRDSWGYFVAISKQLCRSLLCRCSGHRYVDHLEKINDLNSERFIESNRLLRNIINENDLVYTKPIRLVNCEVRTFFETIGRVYIDVLVEVLQRDFPEYYDDFKAVLAGNKLSAANMLIIRIDYFDGYCNFVFNALASHLKVVKERGICISPETEGVYARVSGYLAEILTAVYIEKNKSKLKSRGVRKFFIEN